MSGEHKCSGRMRGWSTWEKTDPRPRLTRVRNHEGRSRRNPREREGTRPEPTSAGQLRLPEPITGQSLRHNKR
uniref:Uncharacterized protein n=1 Tax=Trichuris muris TaxID=70415 RepID=A0A5S6QDE4_TRIMR